MGLFQGTMRTGSMFRLTFSVLSPIENCRIVFVVYLVVNVRAGLMTFPLGFYVVPVVRVPMGLIFGRRSVIRSQEDVRREFIVRVWYR